MPFKVLLSEMAASPALVKMVVYMTGITHVHVHYLSTDAELEADGHGDVEFCCHACSSAVIVRYPREMLNEAVDGTGHPEVRKILEGFAERHALCGNGDGIEFTSECPARRDLVHCMDLT